MGDATVFVQATGQRWDLEFIEERPGEGNPVTGITNLPNVRTRVVPPKLFNGTLAPSVLPRP